MRKSKKTFSLVEVLIAITLLSIVIVVILQMQQNSFYSLDITKKSFQNSGYISYAVDEGVNRNTNIFLSQKVNFKDDKIDKELKNIKVTIKDQLDKTISLENEYVNSIQVIKTTYTIENKMVKSFFRFEIE